MSLFAAIAGLSMVLQTSGFNLNIPGLQAAPKPESTLVKVNGVEIKAQDIADLLWDSKAEEVLNEVMYYQLAKSEADKIGVFVTNQEIEEGVAREIDSMRQNLPPEQTLEQFMLTAGQTKARLHLAVKTSLLLTKIAFSDFDPSTYIKVATIIVKPKSSSAADLSSAIKIAEGAYAKLIKGDSWESVVDDTVTDETGRQSRGRLGWRQIAAFPTDVQKDLEIMKPNGVTKPVQTPNGIQLFRIEQFGKGQTRAQLDQMRIDLTESLRVQAVNKIRRSVQIERLWPNKPKPSGG